MKLSHQYLATQTRLDFFRHLLSFIAFNKANNKIIKEYLICVLSSAERNRNSNMLRKKYKVARSRGLDKSTEIAGILPHLRYKRARKLIAAITDMIGLSHD